VQAQASGLEAIQGKAFEALTPEELNKLADFQAFTVVEYYKILPILYAWLLVSRAFVPINEENKNIALDAINATPAYKVFGVFESFFLNRGIYSTYPQYLALTPLLWQLTNYCLQNKICTSPYKTLTQRHK
jgi:hypothetical protein